MELVKPVEPVLWACIVELVMGGTGYGTVEALVVGTVMSFFGDQQPPRLQKYSVPELISE